MSRSFDGVDDVINLSNLSAFTDWSMFAWVYPLSRGEGGGAGSSDNARIMAINAEVRALFWVGDDGAGGIYLQGRQGYATTPADATSSTLLPLNQWSFVACTFTLADVTTRLYLGDVDTPVAECAYTSQVAGVGTRDTTLTDVCIGNRGPASLIRTWDGRITRAGFLAGVASLPQLERLRLGAHPVQQGGLRFYLPLDSPTAATARDLSGNGNNGTVSGCTVAEDPPIPSVWSAVF